MKNEKFSKLETKVRDISARRAYRQLMSVPWLRFHTAYEKYIRWHGFALWVRAVAESEGSIPSWLAAVLRKRCPGFSKEAARSNKAVPLSFQLLSWVHNQAFAFAEKEGWLDALVFYGFRDARAQGSWEYWEHCESEWRRRRPVSFPAFPEWRRSALDRKLQGNVGCAAVAKAVEKYLNFESLVNWLRPLLQAPQFQLPAYVALDLEQEYPGLLKFVNTHVAAACRDQSRSWRRLLRWGKDHLLSQEKERGGLGCVLFHARMHPRHLRIVRYAAHCRKSRLENPALPHPSLRQWQRQVRSWVETSRRSPRPTPLARRHIGA
jgi:hypothetical protein